jgi:hypothetical protein
MHSEISETNSILWIPVKVIGKIVWGSGGIALSFLTSALDGSEWWASRPNRFTPGERAPGTHCIGGWVGPRR